MRSTNLKFDPTNVVVGAERPKMRLLHALYPR